MKKKDTIHTDKWERCFKKVKKKVKDENQAAAICSSSIKNGGVRYNHQRKDKNQYYANIKKELKNLKTYEEFNEINFLDDIDDIEKPQVDYNFNNSKEYVWRVPRWGRPINVDKYEFNNKKLKKIVDYYNSIINNYIGDYHYMLYQPRYNDLDDWSMLTYYTNLKPDKIECLGNFNDWFKQLLK
jgi:hypothetical protein